jgi:hypothetical protein
MIYKSGLCPDSVARNVFQVFQVAGEEEKREKREYINNLIRSKILVQICSNAAWFLKQSMLVFFQVDSNVP